MFTGIIEELGIVKNVRSSSKSMQLEIEANKIITDMKNGDSIAVNGTCLTVTWFTKNSFCVDIMPETFNTTSLRLCKVLSKVNLERSLAIGNRLGGHFVSGHVDGTGTIKSIKPQENAIYYEVELNNPALLQYCIYHGSIAIDGTSLTIFGLTKDTLTVSLIPHTTKNSVIGYKNTGDIVNIECDMLAKLVAQAIKYSPVHENDHNGQINANLLQLHGFI